MNRILVSKSVVAEMLGVSRRTVETLVAVGELKSRRIGRRRLFDVREIERFCRRDHSTQQRPTSGTGGIDVETNRVE